MEINPQCERCTGCSGSEDQTLYELGHMDDKSLSNLMNECRHSMKGLYEEAWNHASQRAQEKRGNMAAAMDRLRDLQENFSYKLLEELVGGEDMERLLDEYLGDEERKHLEEELMMLEPTEEGVSAEDIKKSLQQYVEKDLVEIDNDRIRITPKGSEKLAKYVLRRIRENLSGFSTGTNATKEEGFGVSYGFGRRKYEYGDEFYKIDMEKTLMSALERTGNKDGSIRFEEEDVWVKETIIDTRLCVGLIVDESGSMNGDKIHAATDICMALSELTTKNSRDTMKLFLFSNQVREVPYWEVLNVTFSGGTTDIRAAMKKFRTSTSHEKADKQVYLITDTEPNCEEGRYVGFEKASLGVMKEAMAFQREGITLNIIMLDTTPHLRQFATMLAKRNLGRVFFAEPKDLGTIVVEDYLRSKKRQRNRKM